VTRLLTAEPDVARVRSLSNWNPAWSSAQNVTAAANITHLPSAARVLVSNLVNLDGDSRVARILVEPRSGPDSDATSHLVQRVRADLRTVLPVGYRALVGGQTAEGLDFDQRVKDSALNVILAVFGVTFIVLLITFRSIFLPVKAIILNSLVASASLGALVGVFQHGWVLHWAARNAINSVTPLLLFAVLFGLSMDYEVFILSRIQEVHDRTRNNAESVLEGLTQTAPMVTGAAAIMVAVFGSFALVQLEVVKELGFGLAVAILLDATVVRTILVPVTMKLFGEWNWWLPGSRSSQRPVHPALEAKHVGTTV
jgi:RND superfamily putative drug exporter